MSDVLHTDLPVLVERFVSAFHVYGPITATLQWQGKDSKVGEKWARAFVCYDGVQVGRINFQPVDKGMWKVYGWKHYKPSHYPYEDMDALWYALDAWLDFGYLINVKALAEEAKKNREARNVKIREYRAQHPKKRPHIGTDIKGELWKLVREEYEGAKDTFEALDAVEGEIEY